MSDTSGLAGLAAAVPLALVEIEFCEFRNGGAILTSIGRYPP